MVPTVEAPTDSDAALSDAFTQVGGPAGGGEAAAPSPAEVPRFGHLGAGEFPDGIRAGWICPCGEGGYLLAEALPVDVAGYERDQFDHAEVCPRSGAL